jgi:hypothetical protein
VSVTLFSAFLIPMHFHSDKKSTSHQRLSHRQERQACSTVIQSCSDDSRTDILEEARQQNQFISERPSLAFICPTTVVDGAAHSSSIEK